MKVAAIYYHYDKVERVDVYDGEKAERIFKENLLDKYNLRDEIIKENRKAEVITDEHTVEIISFLKSCEMYNPHIDKGSAVWNKLAHISEQVDECMAMIENDEGVVND